MIRFLLFLPIVLLVACEGEKTDIAPDGIQVDVCECAEARNSGALENNPDLAHQCEQLAMELGTQEVRRRIMKCKGVATTIDVGICDCKEAMISGELETNSELREKCEQLALSISNREFDMALAECEGTIPDEMIKEEEAAQKRMEKLMHSWESDPLNLSLSRDGTFIAVYNLEDHRVEQGIWTLSQDTLILIADSLEYYHPIVQLQEDQLTLSVDGEMVNFSSYQP